MKIIVDKMPEAPDKCMYGVWSGCRACSFIMCRNTGMECVDTKACPFFTDKIPPKEE